MHCQLHPRRRPPAAAPGVFPGRSVAPVAESAPVAGVKPSFTTAVQAALAGSVPPDGTHMQVSARRSGGVPLHGRAPALSAGRPVQDRQMRSSQVPVSAWLADASASPTPHALLASQVGTLPTGGAV